MSSNGPIGGNQAASSAPASAVPRGRVVFEHLDGAKGMMRRLRNSAVTIAAIAISLMSTALSVINPERGFLAWCAPILAWLISLPLIAAVMRVNMRRSNSRLVDLIDRKGEFELTDEQFKEASNWFLKLPWIALGFNAILWFVIGIPAIWLTERVFSARPSSVAEIAIATVMFLPFVWVALLLRLEQVLSPYVQALFSSRGLTSLDSPLALTSRKRFLLLFGVTGPYLMLLYGVALTYKFVTAPASLMLQELITVNGFFLALLTISWYLANRYISTVVERPMAQLQSILRGETPDAVAGTAQRVDEWLVVTELLRKKSEAETALRLSEAKFRLVIEVMPIGALILDQSSTVESTNAEMLRLLHKQSSDLLGVPAWDLLNLSQEKWNQIVSGEADGARGEPINLELAADEERSYIELMARPFETDTGHKYLLLIHDVTERKRIERVKQEFFAMVSHELRTPLTSIKGLLSLMARGAYGTLTESGLERTKGGAKNAERLIKLVSDLLDAEKLESGQFDYLPGDTTAAKLCERAMDAVHDLASENGVKIESAIEDADLHVDEDRIVQVLVNLLGNAIKFAGGQPILLRVERIARATTDGAAGAATDSAAVVKFSVVDHGPGIPDDKKSMVFEKFKQIATTQRAADQSGRSTHGAGAAADQSGRARRGTGLGLPIARAVVLQHGGSIGIDDTEGGGSTFWFTIPPHNPSLP